MADIDIKKEYQERFAELPKIVQDAITSAQISKGLQKLSEENKLHVDQWDKLENEVMFALLGLTDTADLPQNIAKNVVVADDLANTLAQQISANVFEPIREQLDRQLGSPQAKEEVTSDVEQVRDQMLKDAGVRPGGDLPAQPDPAIPPTITDQIITPEAPVPPVVPVQPAVLPGTPPAAAPDTKVERGPISESYHAQNPSTDRKTVDGDPYREQLK